MALRVNQFSVREDFVFRTLAVSLDALGLIHPLAAGDLGNNSPVRVDICFELHIASTEEV